MKSGLLLCVASLIFLGTCQESSVSSKDPAESPKPRTIVTTDGEIDDVDSFIRMLLYANEFDLEGLVYSSSMWHYKGDGKGTLFTSEMEWTRDLYGERTELRWPGTSWMEGLIAEYEKIQPNLSLHAEGYPTADELRALITVGNIDFEGDMAEPTAGSELIKNVLLDDNPQPVYLQAWGGTNTIARALKSIEEEYSATDQWADIYQKVSDKAIIYAITDQDATLRQYIGPHWPDIRVFYNGSQFWCFAYPWTQVVPDELQPYLRGSFMGNNILHGHGPLLEKYYAWGDGQHQAGDPEHTHGDTTEMRKNNMTKDDFISEGDSPAYLQLVETGLGNLENPSYGGWGGRLIQSADNPRRWEDGKHVTDFNFYTDTADASFPQTRWIEAIQMDFAARADWCVMNVEEANHAPTISVAEGTALTAAPGETLTLTASATDPDGDAVDFTFWQYAEAGTSEAIAEIVANGPAATVRIPETAEAGKTIHLIVEGRDQADAPMIRYARVIVTVN